MPSGDGNVLTIHTNDGTERFRIDSSGNVKVGSACTISQDGDVFFTGVCTATTLAGAASGLTGALPALDGSALTGVASTDNIRTNTDATFLKGVNVSGVTTVTSVKVGTAVTISESGIAAAGIGITVANINGGQVGGRRNMVMNGAMQVAQRGTSSTSNGYQTIDRWDCSASGMDQLAFTQKQSSDHPAGHYYSFEVDITTAETAQAGDEYMRVQHIIEAQDLQHLAYGTSSAKTTTLSFWVEAKQTGTYAVNWYSSDGSRHISRTYTINAADTWEHKTLTIPGDTGGTINNDNGSGIHLAFILIADSGYVSANSTSWGSYSDAGFAYGHNVNMGSSADNYWRITGVQWEVGAEGTSYEHRSYGDELSLCQRYFLDFVGPTPTSNLAYAVGTWYNSGYIFCPVRFPVAMRASPSLEGSNNTNDFYALIGSTVDYFNQNAMAQGSVQGARIYPDVGTAAAGSSGSCVVLHTELTTAKLRFNAELS